MSYSDKEKALADYVNGFSFPAIAFSGGRDSSFLAWFIRNKMKKDALILCVDHELIPLDERKHRSKVAKAYGWTDLESLSLNLLDLPEISSNSLKRCYFCKRYLMGTLADVAKERGCDALFDGTTLDERTKYRPGLKALEELGIISPLAETGWTKKDVQNSCRDYKLLFADRAPESCLATRFPYNQRLTVSLIRAVDEIEQKIKSTIDGPVRVRVHPAEQLIRIEVDLKCAKDLFVSDFRKELVGLARSKGFVWISVDIEGFRSGSWDVAVKSEQ